MCWFSVYASYSRGVCIRILDSERRRAASLMYWEVTAYSQSRQFYTSVFLEYSVLSCHLICIYINTHWNYFDSYYTDTYGGFCVVQWCFCVFFINFTLEIEYALICIVCFLCVCTYIRLCVSVLFHHVEICVQRYMYRWFGWTTFWLSLQGCFDFGRGEYPFTERYYQFIVSRVWSTVTIIANGQFSDLSREGGIVDFWWCIRVWQCK